MKDERTAAEQAIISQKEKAFYARTISTAKRSQFVKLWVGPKNRKEIDLALQGSPTLVDCSVGPNINDGSMDGRFYRDKNGWKTIAEYNQWLETAKPRDIVYPCPFCDDFTGTSKDELATHISKYHSTTPDFEGKYKPEDMGVVFEEDHKSDGEKKFDEESINPEQRGESVLDEILGTKAE